MDELPPPLPSTTWPPPGPPALWRDSAQAFAPPVESSGPVGLGGWLILVTISFILRIPYLAYHLFTKWKIFFADPAVWQRLATPGSPHYRPLWGTVMIYETAGNAVWLLCSIALAVLFCQRRRLFKPLMIAYQVGSIAYLWFDHYLVLQVTATTPEHVAQLIGQTIGTLLWTLYLLLSQRVRNTFVR